MTYGGAMNIVQVNSNNVANTGTNVPAGTLPVVATDGVLLFSNTISSANTGAWLDTTGFQSISIQASGNWTGVITIEGSNDSSANSATAMFVSSLNSTVVSDVINKQGMYNVKTSSKYIRYNVRDIGEFPVTLIIYGRAGAGASTGDYLGLALDAENKLPLQVEITRGGGLFDSRGAAVPSDAEKPIQLYGIVGEALYIDTQGYQSVHITTQTLAGAVTVSNDLITFTALTGMTSIGGFSTSLAATTSYSFPVQGRYIRIVPTTAGTATVYLRQTPFSLGAIGTQPVSVSSIAGNLTGNQAINVVQVAGSALVTTNLAGMLAVGGNIAAGVAPTANPILVSGIDTTLSGGLTRRLLTDPTGRVVISGATPGAASTALPAGALPNQPTAPLPILPNSIQNVGAVAVVEAGNVEGLSLTELLYKILIELKIANYQRQNLPYLLNAGQSDNDDLTQLAADPSLFAANV